MSKLSYLFSLFTFSVLSLSAQVPEWIWHPDKGAKPADGEVRFFRKTFSLSEKPNKAFLTAAGDDEVDVWVNGEKVFNSKGWNTPKTENVAKKLHSGENLIAVRGKNETGDAAVLVLLEMDFRGRKKQLVVTDTSWQTAMNEETNWSSANFSPGAKWISAKSLGKHGVQPWGEVIKATKATAVSDLKLLPGFKAELLWSAQRGEGSWICMAIDDKGRLIISPQQDELPLFRVTLSRSGKIANTEAISAPLHQAMGLLYAHDSLYVNGHGPDGTGLYRLVDKNKNDNFEKDEVRFLKKIPGEGEHGYHALVLGPDEMIYMINGNHTKLPEGISKTSPHQHYQEDLLLPREWDAGGHAVGILAPGGHIMRTDPEGKKWELLLGGFRNTYDFDFNADGEMVGFDSDMEWDWGLPWYRPTRIIHAIIGGEYGWRSGSGKWPTYYPDSLPPAVDIGVGSPTGVRFGTKSDFPKKYRNAFFAMDWSYGRIFAVHLHPQGATYSADFETFVKGKPLNVTDLVFGNDGAMYFITGGRNTQSGLYRVTYTGKNIDTAQSDKEFAAEMQGSVLRDLRHQLEAFDGKKNPKAVDFAWPHLASDDRWIRYAARIAIESQDVSQWQDRALAETNVDAGLTALLALARVGPKETQRDLLLALKNFPVASLTEMQKLEKLRIIELSFIRQGKPQPEIAEMAMEKLNQYYPASTEVLNHELCQLLIYLEAPDVVTKSLALLDKAKTQEDQLYYIFYLRTLKTGWTIDQRKKYFTWLKDAQELAKGDTNNPTPVKLKDGEMLPSREHPAQLIRWFEEADRKFADGVSYPKYLVNIRKDAIASLTTDEKTALGELAAEKKEAVAKKPSKERKFVKEWKLSDLEPALDKVGHGRNFEQGKTVFSDAQCILCHRYGNEGGSVGPELTVVSSRFNRSDILDSILEPSKVLSEQFQNIIITKKDGDDVTGRIVDETDDKIVVEPNPLSADRVEVKKSDIEKRAASKLSPMPEGLLNTFSQDEILDLLAYIESLGKPGAENFTKKKK